MTFRDVADAYIAANEESWRNPKDRQQWRNTLDAYVYPVFGDLPVADVGTTHVLKILEPIWKGKAETASRVRGRMETVLDSAKARGYREGENPARWRGHLARSCRLERGSHADTTRPSLINKSLRSLPSCTSAMRWPLWRWSSPS
jgi:hypothetical protein